MTATTTATTATGTATDIATDTATDPAAPTATATDTATDTVIELQGVATRFGEHRVHDGLDLTVRRAEIFALIGGSGSGKSTLLREMILLHRPDAGQIRVLGQDLLTLDAAQAVALCQRWGVMFQHGGLFSALNVRENVGLPLREHSALDDALIDGIAEWRARRAGPARPWCPRPAPCRRPARPPGRPPATGCRGRG